MATKKQQEEKSLVKTGAAFLQAPLPEYLQKYKGQKLGQENVDRDDVLIPRLGLCQALSPQKKKANEAYIEGLEEGDLFNTVSGEIYGRSVIVIPLFFFKQFIHFKPIDEGGGIIAQYKNKSSVPEELMSWVDGNPPVVTEFKNQLCALLTEEGKLEPIVVSFKSTGIKIAKKWQNYINLLDAPSFVRTYKLEVFHKVEGKQEWEGLNVFPGEFSPGKLVADLEKLFEQFKDSDDINFDTRGMGGEDDESGAAGNSGM
jgi:hypothetical protein